MLQFRTPLNSRGFSGYPLDELKSGLQKYLRRGKIEKMVWCMEELFLFGVLERINYIFYKNIIKH